MNFQREPLFCAFEDLAPLAEMHNSELTRGAIPLDMNWAQYAALESAGILVLFTCREEFRLVGYSAFILAGALHHKSLMVAQNDSLFLHPEFRRGTTALRFIDYCDGELKKLGAQKIVYHVTLAHDWRPILHRRGFEDEEIAVTKLL